MAVPSAQWKLNWRVWYQCQTAGQCKVELFNTNTAFAKGQEFMMTFVSPQAGLRSPSSWSSSAAGHKDITSGAGHPTADPWKTSWCSGMALL